MEKYNGYSLATIARLFAIGKQRLSADETITAMEKIANLNLADVWAFNIVEAGERFGDDIDKLEEKTYYRIGEPRINPGNSYYSSYNFADDCPELGVSVVTTAWLHSVKSVFFGAYDDEKLQKRGVFAIKGVQIAFGGDDEPLIIPTDWARKMDIHTVEQLFEVVKQTERRSNHGENA